MVQVKHNIQITHTSHLSEIFRNIDMMKFIIRSRYCGYKILLSKKWKLGSEIDSDRDGIVDSEDPDGNGNDVLDELEFTLGITDTDGDGVFDLYDAFPMILLRQKIQMRTKWAIIQTHSQQMQWHQ